jgi:hypothetical protein
MGSETVGMSNDKAGENPARRIPKVSHATAIGVGLVGPKARPKGVADGQQVNIPVPRGDRQRMYPENLVCLCTPFWECMYSRKDGCILGAA